MKYLFFNCTDWFLSRWSSISRFCSLASHFYLLAGGRKQASCFCSSKAFSNFG